MIHPESNPWWLSAVIGVSDKSSEMIQAEVSLEKMKQEDTKDKANEEGGKSSASVATVKQCLPSH